TEPAGVEPELAHASGWPPLLHPHCGSRFLSFWQQYFKHRPYDLRSIYQRGFALLSTTVRVPAMTYERLRHDKKIAAEPLEHGPVFIIGHWRSGTTYLHNLLSHDPQFAWMSFSRAAMPLDCLTPIRPGRDLMNLLLPKTRGMDRMAMNGDTPQEEEIALGVLGEISFYRGLYYPRSIEPEFRRSVLMQDLQPGELELLAKNYRYLAQKMAYAYGGKTVLFKNPASTARISFLKGVFPNAKFIHIVRNPDDVFPSMRNLLQRSFDAFAWQTPEGIELNELVISFYERTMQAHLADRVGVPDSDFCEVRFEDLERDAGGVVREIYRKLGIPEVEIAMGAISGHIRSQDSYQKNVHELSDSLLQQIRERWAFAFERWDY
ncbi:MAG: sulfotransferase family protein, partial [Verrucomicrobiales bacterium]